MSAQTLNSQPRKQESGTVGFSACALEFTAAVGRRSCSCPASLHLWKEWMLLRQSLLHLLPGLHVGSGMLLFLFFLDFSRAVLWNLRLRGLATARCSDTSTAAFRRTVHRGAVPGTVTSSTT